MSEQFELGGIVADLKSAEEQKRVEARAQARAHHRDSMACCWPEWDGNDGIKVGTRISVGTCVVDLAERQAVTVGIPDDDGLRSSMYAYCAPCYVAEVVGPDEFIAVIDYPEGTVEHCLAHNGIRLRLDITDVWPPVADLSAARRAEDKLIEAQGATLDLETVLHDPGIDYGPIERLRAAAIDSLGLKFWANPQNFTKAADEDIARRMLELAEGHPRFKELFELRRHPDGARTFHKATGQPILGPRTASKEGWETGMPVPDLDEEKINVAL